MATRLSRELEQLKSAKPDFIKDIVLDESNILQWTVTILPSRPPYNEYAFDLILKFHENYPFQAPISATFKTRIFHPNVRDEGRYIGEMPLSMICPANWRPTYKVKHVLETIIQIINEPIGGHPYNEEAGQLFSQNPAEFAQAAAAHAEQHAKKR